MGARDLSCGTVACAGGWATTLPGFKERGLFLADCCDAPAMPAGDDDRKHSSSGTDALAEVLEISPSDAELLFLPCHRSEELDMVSPSDKATAREVAEHIRRFMVARTMEEGRA
jgi:hypothetical protein